MTRTWLLGVSAGVVLAAWSPSPDVTLLFCVPIVALVGLQLHDRRACRRSPATDPSVLRPTNARHRKPDPRRGQGVAAFCVGALCGFAIASAQFYVHEQAKVSTIQSQRVSGCVVSAVVSRNGAHRFVFESTHRTAFGRAVRYRVAWYERPGAPVAGSCWRLTLRLKPPRGHRNEAGFDYERWLFARRLSGLATVKSGEHAVELPWRSTMAGYLQARRSLYSQLNELAAGYRSSMLIGALAVGMRDGLSPDDWEVLKRTGTAHLMAISGLHVGLAALFGFALGRYLPIRLHTATNLVRRGALTSLIVAFAYAAVAGFAVSTVRALVMLALWHLWRLLFRSVHVSTTLLLTMAGVLLCYPWMAADISFWLSTGAVMAITAAAYGRPVCENLKDRVAMAFRIQFGMTLLMLPVAVIVAGGVSWVSVPVNLVLIPLFSVCIVPLVLILLILIFVAPSLAGAIVSLLGMVLDWVWFTLSWLAAHSGAFTPLTSTSPWITVPVSACGVLLLLPRAFPARNIGWVLLLPVFFTRAERPSYGEFWLDVLDVGQALAVIVQTQSATLVYDTGNAWPGGNSANSTILPVLHKRQVTQLHTLVVSHADRDHAGGATYLQESMPVNTVWIGEPVAGLSDAQHCRAGIRWQLDGVRFEFLHPPQGVDYHGNPASCVLHVGGKAGHALLTGDLGKAHERRLIPALAERSVDVVVGAHHGSLSSSDPLFADATRPGFVVFSNGFGNQWGMPRAEIVSRWEFVGTRVLTTARSGQLSFRGSRNGELRLSARFRQRGWGRWRTHTQKP